MRSSEFLGQRYGLLTELEKMASYKNPIGIMEMVKFMKIATPEQKQEMQDLIKAGESKKAWKLLQHVTGTKLD